MALTLRDYRIFDPKNKLKAMVITYEDGVLNKCVNINLLATFWEGINITHPLPLLEEELEQAITHFPIPLVVEVMPVNKTNVSIALFIQKYKHYIGSDYILGKSDARSIAGLLVNEEILDAYFTNTEWWGKKQPKSISNFERRYNDIRFKQAMGALDGKNEVKSPHPDHYSREHEKTLSTSELSTYWSHLRRIGFKAKKNSLGIVVDWEKVPQSQAK
jgi:hypothetical protein